MSRKNKPQRGSGTPLNGKWFGRIAVLTAVLVLLVLFMVLPVFRISKITVGQTMFVRPETIIEAAELKQGQHFLAGYGGSFKAWIGGRYSQAAAKIERKLPEIRTAEVKFVFPSEISIAVTERVAIGWLRIPDGCAVIDHEGCVLSILTQPPEQIPMIIGIQSLNLKVGETVRVDAPKDLERAIAVMTALLEADYETEGDYLLSRISKIEPTINQEIRLTVVDGEQHLLVICSQNSYLVEHFSWLKRLINDGIMHERGSGTLDLTGKQRTFRPDRQQ